MREFGKISTALWTNSKKFKSLDDEAKLLYLYMHSCPHVNSVGCYYLPKGYISADLGWNDRSIDRAMKALCIALIQYNKTENIVKIEGFLDHSKITNKNHAIGAVKIVMSLPDCEEKYSIINELKRDKYCKSLPEIKTFERPIDSPMDRGIPTETETETYKEKDISNDISKKDFSPEENKDEKPYVKSKTIEDFIEQDCFGNSDIPEKFRKHAEKHGHPNAAAEWEDFVSMWKRKGEEAVSWFAGWEARVRNSKNAGWYTEKGNRNNSGRQSRGGGPALTDIATELIAEYGDEG